MVLLDTGTPGTNREIYSEAADGETLVYLTSDVNNVVSSMARALGL